METNAGLRNAILIVDDDVRLCRLIVEFFSDSVYRIEAAHTGPSGLARALDEKHDLITSRRHVARTRWIRDSHPTSAPVERAGHYAHRARRS